MQNYNEGTLKLNYNNYGDNERNKVNFIILMTIFGAES